MVKQSNTLTCPMFLKKNKKISNLVYYYPKIILLGMR